jgi:heme A synthase
MRTCYGYRRITVLLQREGWAVNAKRVYRLYRERGLESRVTRAGVLALALLPLQAGLGALTVLKSQVFPGGSHVLVEGLISAAHYGTGVGLFTALVAATLWAYEDTGGPRPAPSPDDD